MQYKICYQFSHRIPSTIYERFCARLQRHLEPGVCIRQDAKNQVYIQQGGIKLFMEKIQSDSGPYILLNFRCILQCLPNFATLVKEIVSDMEGLLDEHPGIVTDKYIMCPNCLMLKREATESRKHLLTPLSVKPQSHLMTITCDPTASSTEASNHDIQEIPAAMIYLQLLGKYIVWLNNLKNNTKFLPWFIIIYYVACKSFSMWKDWVLPY